MTTRHRVRDSRFPVLIAISTVLILTGLAVARPAWITTTKGLGTITANAVPPDSCSDTDGGLNAGVQGTIHGYSNGTAFSKTDYCSNSTWVIEYLCSSMNGFPEPCNFGCSNGACNPAPVYVYNCKDSDNGVNTSLRGTVSGFFNNTPYNYSDYCVDANNVYKYYCDMVRQAGDVLPCSSGCVNGVCLPYSSQNISMLGVTLLANDGSTTLSCHDLCARYSSQVVNNACYDSNLVKCTVTYSNTCIAGAGPDYLVTKDYATQCCCSGTNFGGCRSTAGLSPYVKGGTTNKFSSTFIDKCLGLAVADSRCDVYGQIVYFLNTLCPYGCENGACKTSGTDLRTYNWCNKSDGIFDPKKHGYTYGAANGVLFNQEDTCTDDSRGLYEWFCANNRKYFAHVYCPTGTWCGYGSCNAALPSTYCYDSDLGITPNTRGAVGGLFSGIQYANEDYCINGTAVLEYYCAGNLSSGSVQNCQYGCTDGVCNTAWRNSCTDSDGGIIASTKGTIKGSYNGTNYSNTDYCIDTNNLMEYYCTANMRSGTIQNCQYGCNNGACGTAPQNYCTDTDGGVITTTKGTIRGSYNGTNYTNTDYCYDGINLVEYYCSGTNRNIQITQCPNKCIDGTCSTVTRNYCIDSDGGANFVLKGTVNGSSNGIIYAKTDYCINSTALKEYYCVGNLSKNVTTICSCSSSVCFLNTSDSCSDSDGGINPVLYGAAYGYSNGEDYINHDYCLNSTTVAEQYCLNNQPRETMANCPWGYFGARYCCGLSVCQYYYRYSCAAGRCNAQSSETVLQWCPYGCSNGSCNAQSNYCTDSDGGLVPATRGAISGVFSGTNFTNTDYCINTNRLMEYYCTGNLGSATAQNCSNGCSNGACVAPQTCTDTDGGKNYYVKGFAENAANPQGFWDECTTLLGKPAVTEQYCDQNGDIYFSTVECPYGCSDGACTQQTTPTITVISPNGGETCMVGSVCKISWTYNAIDPTNAYFAITLTKGNTEIYNPYTSKLSDLNQSSLDWRIPGNTNNLDITNGGSDYKIKLIIYNYNTGLIQAVDYSDASFNIQLPFCTDSDGGMNFQKLGTTCIGDNCTTDFCSGNVEYEYYCANNTRKVMPSSCFESCLNGECKQYCRDSDKGINYSVKGSVFTSGGEVGVDFCRAGSYNPQMSDRTFEVTNCSYGVNNCQLVENYCSGNYSMWGVYNCPNGCSNGACTATTSEKGYAVCVVLGSYYNRYSRTFNPILSLPAYNTPDTGDGYAKLKLGKVQDLQQAQALCADEIFRQLARRYCAVNSAKWPAIKWEVGFYDTFGYKSTTFALSGSQFHDCKESTKPISCSDTDKGIRPSATGKVYGYSHGSNYTYQDHCVADSPTSIVEYYCSNKGPFSFTLTCNSTSVCDAGRCISVPDTFLPEKCTMPSGVACLDFTASAKQVSLFLQNTAGFDMTGVTVHVNGTGCDVDADGQATLTDGQRANYVAACSPSPGKFKGVITMTYTHSQTNLTHRKYGDLIVNI